MFYLFIFIVGIVSYLSYNNQRIQVSNYNLTSSSPKQTPLVIAHLSDLHNAAFGRDQKRLVTKLLKNQPDLIVITGDLIDSRHPNVTRALATLTQLQKIAPTYFVSGNHEQRLSGYIHIRQQIKALGVIVMDDVGLDITINDHAIALLGLQDPSFLASSNKELMLKERAATLLKLKEKTSADYTILLSHQPQLLEVYERVAVDLVLSGHAHGGQFRLSQKQGLFAPGQGFFPHYTKGAYPLAYGTLIVSAGLGPSSIPLRVHNPPHLNIIAIT
ncbi:MAG: metallophosphoesterase [Erysipelotrichaceae bacterium]